MNAYACLIVLACLAGAPDTPAGGRERTAALVEAGALLEAGEWSRAEAAYRAILADAPASGDAWAGLAYALRRLDRHADAARAYGAAIDHGIDTPQAHTGLAIVRWRGGDADGAFDALRRAVGRGLPPAVMTAHPDLAPLREDARFQELFQDAEAGARPCARAPRYGALDFWVGTWEAIAGGRRAGVNRIEKILDECAVLESWTSSTGAAGTSLNYFDPSTGRWRQNRVSDSGVVVRYEGEVIDGALRLSGEHIRPDGARTPARVTLAPLPDGRVRHLIEHSRDDGATWFVWFDAVYVRMEDKAPPVRP